MQEAGNHVAALAGINVSLAGFAALGATLMPYLSVLLVLVQITVGVLTIAHILRAERRSRKKNDEEESP
jgi:NADH:ubiquinone oxidoreductase subunit 3 (subunit A)